MSKSSTSAKKRKESEDEITAQSLVNELISNVETTISKRSEKLNGFVRSWNKEFGNKFIWERSIIMSQIMPLMKGALTLYALNMNGQVIIDLAGILERYAIVYISGLFRSFPDRETLVSELLSRRYLDDLAQDLVKLGLWDKEDVSDVIQIKKARDGIAHKNVKIIQKRLHNGKPLSLFDIDLVISSIDVLPYIMTTLHLLVKLVMRYSSKTDRGLIAQAMLDGTIRDDSEITKLFK